MGVPDTVSPSERERSIRQTLGIPEDAERVLIFGETSHWDPNWLLTSEEYYERRVEPILDAVLDELEREERRIFGIECLFFVRMYWTRRPEQRERLRRLVARKQLRFTGTGITTPDTVLPSTEAILRDYLLGQQWLWDAGLDAEPRVAYLPDDFGHSPALPAILRALGFDQAAVTRIDGMYFVGADLRLPSSFPLPGSSAELLTHDLSTLDFVWRAPDGSEVLTHWNAFTYFQGDMLAHLGVFRWMGMVVGIPWRTGRHIARRIAQLVRQLEPLSRTPYLFCPVGCDFNEPIQGLAELLDRYDRSQYGETGTWAISAGLDDYLNLVDCHRDRLPTLELDPNPYWMGFYASRPCVKRACSTVARKLILAEELAFRRGDIDPDLDHVLHRAWDLVAVSNHHDFITGTSPERVFRAEQQPWLLSAESLADTALYRVASKDAAKPPTSHAPPPSWRRKDGRVEIETPHVHLVLSEDQGGCIVGWETPTVRGERLLGPANDLVAYEDSGGLWRMGHEYLGGHFRELARTSDAPARVVVREIGGTLEVTTRAELCGFPFLRRLWIHRDSPRIRMHVEGTAAERHTVTCRVPTVSSAEYLTMDVPGGVVSRPWRKLYEPTFWPARNFAHMEAPEGWGMVAFLGGPACVGLTRPGVLEWVVARHAPFERAFGVLPLLAHPASGIATGEGELDYGVWLTGPGDFHSLQLPYHARQLLLGTLFDPTLASRDIVVHGPMQVDRKDVILSTLKPASRGEGFIARLRCYDTDPFETGHNAPVELTCSFRPIRAASLCDARERDLRSLTVSDGRVLVPLAGSITTVRLHF